MDDGWTLDELVRRAALALAADDVRAPNGRVRDLPDGRAIRWYATIGLVDRPLASRGRTARYGPRHLRQVVAVKRRQAQGRTLAEIQAELAGATDAALAAAAHVPADLLTGPGPASADTADADTDTADTDTADTRDAGRAAGAGGTDPAANAAPGPRPRFWADRPAPAARSAGHRPAAAHRPRSTPADPADPADPAPVDQPPVRVRGYLVALGGGVGLTLPVLPDHEDLAAIAAAATELITVLAQRGLCVTPEGDSR